jgi:hypothetical protein
MNVQMAEFGQRQAVDLGRDVHRGQGTGIEVGRLEGPARRDVREAHQGVHEGQLPRVIELQPGEARAGGEHRGLGEASQLAPIDEGLEDVLLDVEIRIDNPGEPLA